MLTPGGLVLWMYAKTALKSIDMQESKNMKRSGQVQKIAMHLESYIAIDHPMHLVNLELTIEPSIYIFVDVCAWCTLLNSLSPRHATLEKQGPCGSVQCAWELLYMERIAAHVWVHSPPCSDSGNSCR